MLPYATHADLDQGASGTATNERVHRPTQRYPQGERTHVNQRRCTSRLGFGGATSFAAGGTAPAGGVQPGKPAVGDLAVARGVALLWALVYLGSS